MMAGVVKLTRHCCTPTVSYKRFVDTVLMAIDHEIIPGLREGIYKALQEGLQITRPDRYACCKSMLEEHIGIMTIRRETREKMERLQAACQELRRLT